MRRGFKAEAERRALEVRHEMGKPPHEGLDAVERASISVRRSGRADELTTREKLEELEALRPGAFSACTWKARGQHVIVYSPLCSPGRDQSDIAHEVAHLLLGHELKTVQTWGSSVLHMRQPGGAGSQLARRLLAPATTAIARSCQARRLGLRHRRRIQRQRADRVPFTCWTTGVQRQLAATQRHR